MAGHTLRRALWALAHPVTLAAVLTLLLNDHLFKALWPGWVTGKLGDVAGLVFLPPLLAGLLALLPLSHRDRWVGPAAFALAGGWWALAVTIPDVHSASLALLTALTGAPFWFERDPSDLLALPGLLLAWWVWRRSGRQVQLRPSGAVVGALALVACVATSSPVPGYGVTCLRVVDGHLQAASDGATQWWSETRDGGFTWTEVELQTRSQLPQGCEHPKGVSNPDDPSVRYALSQDGLALDRSTDSGRSWRRSLDLAPFIRDTRLTTLQRIISYRSPDEPKTTPPRFLYSMPIDMAFDPGTRNVVLAMGHLGVLVGTPENQWQWSAIRSYHYQELAPDTTAAQGAPFILLLLLPLLVGLITDAFRQSAWYALIGTISALAGTLGCYLYAGAATASKGDLGSMLGFPGWVLAVGCTLPASFMAPAVLDLVRSAKQVLCLLGWLVLASVVFLVPFGLWAAESLATFLQATALAVFATAAVTFAGNRAMARGRRRAAYDGAAAGSAPTA